MRVSSYRITWRARPVSTLSRVPASALLSSARHWAAAQTLRTSTQEVRLAIWLIMLIRACACTVIGEVIFGSNSLYCARLSLASPDVNLFIRWWTRIFHLCSDSRWQRPVLHWWKNCSVEASNWVRFARGRHARGRSECTHEEVRSSAWLYERKSYAVYDSDRHIVKQTVCMCTITGVRLRRRAVM